MRKVILALLVCAMTTSVHAMDFDFGCEKLAFNAEQIMSLRQDGASKASQLRDIRAKYDEYEERGLYVEVVEEAYTVQQQSTEKDRLLEVKNFGMEHFSYCKKMEILFMNDL